MASSLSKEMGMMEAQLKRWKETSHETLSLLDEAHSLKSLLNMKVQFYPYSIQPCLGIILHILAIN